MQNIKIESINHDYIPGSPESRLAYFVTLKYPPVNLLIGSIIILTTPVSRNELYVEDISGRNVIFSGQNFYSVPGWSFYGRSGIMCDEEGYYISYFTGYYN